MRRNHNPITIRQYVAGILLAALVVVLMAGVSHYVSAQSPPLALSDFDSAGLSPDLLALIQTGSSADGNWTVLYDVSPAVGSLLDGELGLGSGNSAVADVRWRGGTVNQLRLENGSDLDLSSYFGTGGAGADLSIRVQTADGLGSGSIGASSANNVRFAMNASAQTLLNGLTSGDRLIIAVVRASTLPGAPTAPRLGGTDYGLTVLWDAPADGGSPITGYNLEYQASGAADWTSWPHSGTTRSAHITGLLNGTYYNVRVRAVNATGNGLWSPSATVQSIGRPNAPGLPVLGADDQSLTVSWTAPTGTSLTGYQVEYRAAGAWSSWPHTGTGTTTTITGLANGTAYEVRVRGVNAVGNGIWSPTATATPQSLPAAPAAPNLTAANARVTASWVAPADGGFPITGYDVEYRVSSTPSWTDAGHTGTGTSITIWGLVNGTAYQVRIRAITSLGNGPWSPEASATPTVGDLGLTGPSSIRDSRTWATFTHNIGGGRAITATSSGAGLAIATVNTALPPCTAATSVSTTAGANWYVAGCATGSHTIAFTDVATGAAMGSVSVSVTATPTITLTPNPSLETIRVYGETGGGVWHRIEHNAATSDNYRITAETGDVQTIAVVSASDASAPDCSATGSAASVLLTDGNPFYLGGCAEGSATVRIKTTLGYALQSYNINVLPPDPTTINLVNPTFRFTNARQLYLPGESAEYRMLNSLRGSFDDDPDYHYTAVINRAGNGGDGLIRFVMRSHDSAAHHCFETGNGGYGSVREVRLEQRSRLDIRACTFRSGDLPRLDLQDGIVANEVLEIYRSTATDSTEELVTTIPLTVYANDLVSTRPPEYFRMENDTYRANIADTERYVVPVTWRHPSGPNPTDLSNANSRYLIWVQEHERHRGDDLPTNDLFVSWEDADDSTQDCQGTFTVTRPATLSKQDAQLFLRICSGRTGLFALQLYYGRSATNFPNNNLIRSYQFESTGGFPTRVPGESISNLGVAPTPTPDPNADALRSTDFYTGQRPNLSGVQVAARESNPLVLDVTVFWDELDDASGYDVEEIGGERQQEVQAPSVLFEGYYLASSADTEIRRYRVRGYLDGGADGYVTQQGRRVAPFDRLYSPWSIAYPVLLKPGGGTLGGNLTPGVAEASGGLSPDEFQAAQEEIAGKVTEWMGLDPDSARDSGLLMVVALGVAGAAAAAVLVGLGVSPSSMFLGVMVFTLIFSVGGPLIFGISIAAAAIFPILMALAGVGLLRAKKVV